MMIVRRSGGQAAPCAFLSGTTLLYHAGTTRILSSVRQFVSFPYCIKTETGDLSSLCKAVDIRRSLCTYGTSRGGYRARSCAASIMCTITSPAACRLTRAVQGCHVAAAATWRPWVRTVTALPPWCWIMHLKGPLT